MSPPKPLPLDEITRRLKTLGFELLPGPDDLLAYARLTPPHFPYATTRKIAYEFPKYYQELALLPVEIVDNILLHLFISYDEEQQFWGDEGTVH